MTKTIRGRIERLELSSEDPAGIAERLTVALGQVKRDPEGCEQRRLRFIADVKAGGKRYVSPLAVRLAAALESWGAS